MKIEIGESLAYSWLRHIKGCQLVQTNWKVSSEWDGFDCEDELGDLIDKVANKFGGIENVFGKICPNNPVDQIIKQAESDVFGIHFEGDTCTYYMVEVAYHKDGLLYETAEKTALKIVEKIVRSAMCLRRYFHTKKGTIVFISPKVGKTTKDTIVDKVDALKTVLNSKEIGYEFDIQLYFNEDFRTSVLEPVLNVSEKVNDTSELFMRSYQLWDLCKKKNEG